MDYWLFQLYININNKDKLKIKLIAKGILEDTQSISTIKNILFILANKVFINFTIKIMLESKLKAKIVFLFNNNTIKKTTILSQFFDLKLFYINSF